MADMFRLDKQILEKTIRKDQEYQQQSTASGNSLDYHQDRIDVLLRFRYSGIATIRKPLHISFSKDWRVPAQVIPCLSWNIP